MNKIVKHFVYWVRSTILDKSEKLEKETEEVSREIEGNGGRGAYKKILYITSICDCGRDL